MELRVVMTQDSNILLQIISNKVLNVKNGTDHLQSRNNKQSQNLQKWQICRLRIIQCQASRKVEHQWDLGDQFKQKEDILLTIHQKRKRNQQAAKFKVSEQKKSFLYLIKTKNHVLIHNLLKKSYNLNLPKINLMLFGT